MARRVRNLVLDSWAVLSYFEDEPAGREMAQILAKAHADGILVSMSVVNVGEVWYILAREVSEEEANQSVLELRQLGIEFVDASWKLAREAAFFKSKGRMSYADCFAAALAKMTGAELVTGDPEFRQVEPLIKVRWLEQV
jgi:predicted nucleic acid-binding protein